VNHPAGSPDQEHPLEALLAEALQRLERDGVDAAERFVAAHPEHAARLREALRDLHQVELVEAPAALPRAFGEFRLLGKLGEGGMGIVYLAEQSSLGREVALKVVRPELLLFEGSRERFRREIDAVARLDHPAIVPILSTGEVDGVPWYAMPRLRGRTAEAMVQAFAGRTPQALTGDDLLAWLAAQDLDASDRSAFVGRPWWFAMVRLVHHAALGIQHAHLRGVLHRDLKPSNLMLTVACRAIVLDFGLAQARGDARLTRTGSAAGSPAYMAPEQLRGEGADERTDVYGLGALLYCLLALEAPFDLDAPELLRPRILAGQRRPFARSHGVPPELSLVVETAMDPERARRYGSAAAFADDLLAVLDGRTIRARRLPWHVRSRRFVGRHRALAAGVAAALLVAAAVPPILLWQQGVANRALARQVERADRSTAATLDAIDRLIGTVALPKLRNVPAAQTMAAGLLDTALAQFERLADDDAHAARVRELRCRTLYDIAQVATRLGQNRKAQHHLEQLLAAVPSATEPAVQLLRARAWSELAWIALREAKFDACLEHVAAARSDLDTDFPPTFAAHVAREKAQLVAYAGGCAEAGGDQAALIRACRERVAILEQVVPAGTLDVDLLAARLALGANLRDIGDRGENSESRALLTAVLAATAENAGPEVGWPVPRLLHAMAMLEIASLDHDERADDRAIANGQASLAEFDALVRDYPHEPALRRYRGRAGNLVGSRLQAQGQDLDARARVELAIADLRVVLQNDPDDRMARRYLEQSLRTLCVSVRELQDWPALEQAARQLGAFGGLKNTPRAAR
jgi:serine/threonine protein kinase/tetratricopeptide (TPR) repeat protein